MSVASNQNVNGCGVPWNWSRIHDRGKSFLDLAGRSLSCGLSESRLRRGGPNNNNNIPVNMSEHSSSSTSKSEALPLLLDSQGSVDDRAGPGWFHDYSGELGIYADNLLKNETDSDLASEGRSREKHHKARNERRHQNLTQKYGPKTFRDLVGQSLAVQALSNAIAKRKIGLLYLFYGPHGTGKTSCARIFARALNCQSLEQPKPCGLCSSCVKSRNVKEIGPVSNIDFGSVIGLLDDMIGSRARSEYRVLIFDECDSLSPECWSAILKVVDRAPRRVVFVLVCSGFDTLPHVIISRCQKFYFPKLKDADVIYTLQWIASKEDLEIDKDALKLIASRSDGSLRDAEMTLEQLSLIGKRISLGLVQELVGLISDEKLVDLLDLALSADTVNTVKNLRDIMESGVEPLALMSQLATVITDILAGSYDFTKEGSRRKFFRRPALSKEDMEKLRQALKTLSEAEKQLRVSNDRMTWLTAALLQLAPDQQYMLPSSDTSFHQSPLVVNNASLREKPRKSNAGNSNNVHYNARSKGTGSDGSHQLHFASNDKEIEEIWLQVLEKIPINSVKEFMYREGKLIAVNYGAAPTVQLLFNSQPTKSKAEKFRLHILQAFESVLRSPVTIEIRCEPRKDVGAGPILLPAAQYQSHLDVVPATHNASNNGIMPITTSHDAGINHRREIVEIEESPRENTTNGRGNIGTSSQKISALLGERDQSLSIVRGKVSLAHVIQHAEGSSQHSGWSKRKAVSIAEKLEQENLYVISKLQICP
ncbi:protein stichel-like 3 [Phtheirospermum japonicum]|uniref:Protein stichel-like 3 n=1 Tax=Phtheirospermum japonicum TaxID=374723 RepID=A0A830CRE7_9LAMI|nr:protein stichel-like 3 [Phtheirospermum japonicum]